MKTLRDEHIKDTNWNTNMQGLWEWFKNLSWEKVLQAIGMAIGTLLLIAMVVMWCVFPLIKLMIGKAVKLVTGQFPLYVQMDDSVPLDKQSLDHLYMDMTPQNVYQN